MPEAKRFAAELTRSSSVTEEDECQYVTPRKKILRKSKSMPSTEKQKDSSEALESLIRPSAHQQKTPPRAKAITMQELKLSHHRGIYRRLSLYGTNLTAANSEEASLAYALVETQAQTVAAASALETIQPLTATLCPVSQIDEDQKMRKSNRMEDEVNLWIRYCDVIRSMMSADLLLPSHLVATLLTSGLRRQNNVAVRHAVYDLLSLYARIHPPKPGKEANYYLKVFGECTGRDDEAGNFLKDLLEEVSEQTRVEEDAGPIMALTFVCNILERNYNLWFKK